MAKLDRQKETINNFRLGLTLVVGIEAILIGGLVTSYRSGVLDFLFWFGVDLAFGLQLLIVYFTMKLMAQTNKLEEM